MSGMHVNIIRLCYSDNAEPVQTRTNSANTCGCGDTKPHMHCGTCYYRGPFCEENFPWYPTYSLCWYCWFANHYELPRLPWWRVAS